MAKSLNSKSNSRATRDVRQLAALLDSLPPHATEAEMALLGSIFLVPSILPDVKAIITSGAEFYRPANGAIYDVMHKLLAIDGWLDIVALNQELVDRGTLDAVGGVEYLVTLASAVPSASNATHYARLVHEKFRHRQLIGCMQELLARVYTSGDDVAQIATSIESSLAEFNGVDAGAELHTLAEYVTDPATEAASVTPTGFCGFDEILPDGGLQSDDKIALAGMPGSGKSAFALQLALSYLKIHPDKRVLWCAGEMSMVQLRNRALSHISNQPKLLLMRPNEQLSPLQLQFKIEGIAVLAALADRLHVMRPPLTPAAIESQIVQTGASLAVIDYLQLVRPDTEGNSTRRDDVDEVVRALTGMATRRKVATVWLSSMPKIAEGSKTLYSCFKESSEIAHAVDLAYLLDPIDEGDIETDGSTPPPQKVQMKLRCLKARNGDPITGALEFDRPTQTFRFLKGIPI